MKEHSVLLIDDDAGVLRAIGRYFEELGYEVLRAEAGKAGLGMWQRHEPDVTIVDLYLPDMSGMEVLDALRREQAVVIMLTGHGDVELAVRAMQMGAESFLTKPIDMSHLTAAVEKAVEKKALRDENAQLRVRLNPSLKRRLLRYSLPAALVAAAAAVGMLIGGGRGEEDVRPRRPIPVPIDTAASAGPGASQSGVQLTPSP